MNWSWLSKLSPKPLLDWLKCNLSSDPASSNSRFLQTAIVLSLIPLLWIVVWMAKWVISDNVRILGVTLIVSGAGAYGFNKLSERSNNG